MIYLETALWGGLTALGFAVLFNVPVRTLAACAAGGAIARLLVSTLQLYGLTIEASTLFGAMVVGFLAVLFAKKWQAPPPVFSIPSVIPLIPGVLAFKTMMGVVALAHVDLPASYGTLLETSMFAVRTLLILAAIAGGIAMPTLLFYRRKPVV